MQKSFIEKLILAVICGALVASLYVHVYKGFILKAEESANSAPASIR